MIDLHGSDSTFTISQKHLSQALTQARMGFWEVNLMANNAMSCTDQCKRNFGWDVSKPFSYEDMLRCILEDDRVEMQEQVALAIREGSPYHAHYRTRHPDGSIHWIEAQGNVTYVEDGMARIISGTTLDITEIKELETLRDEMLSIAMHEIKTPISAVKGTLQIIQRQVDREKFDISPKLLGNALQATERISRLLDDMVAPIMVMAKGIRLDKSEIDVCKLVAEISQNAALVFPESDIQLHLPNTPVLVYADGHRIAQVITNLLNNSIKYSQKTTPIQLYVSQQEAYVHVTVSDLGMGIKPEDRKKIFEKFYRSKITGNIEGLGIGLFLCADIILRHGGQIAVLDKDGPGTDIRFTLPR